MVEGGITATELEDDPASPWYGHARALLGLDLHLAGSPDAAPMLERALSAGTTRPMSRAIALSVTALRTADEGELARAQQLAEEAARIVTGRGFSRWPPSAFVLTALGAVHLRQGRLAEARAELEYALYRRRRWVLLTPWLSAEAQLRLADVLLAMGDLEAAAAVTTEVRNVLTTWPDGADALVARLGEVERRLAGTPSAQPAAAPPAAEPLTEREQAVLSLLRTSLSVSGIARELYLSANTVKTHKRAIYRKLGVSTRQEAIERAPELEHPELPGPADRLPAIGGAKLAEGALQVRLDRVDRDVHLRGDVRGVEHLAHVPQHVSLPAAELFDDHRGSVRSFPSG
jgi:LuxR family maltose regulon positive regulatory protein